jgi:hypothetical protein
MVGATELKSAGDAIIDAGTGAISYAEPGALAKTGGDALATINKNANGLPTGVKVALVAVPAAIAAGFGLKHLHDKHQEQAPDAISTEALQTHADNARVRESLEASYKNSVSPDEFAAMQAAQQNRGSHGKYTQAALAQESAREIAR